MSDNWREALEAARQKDEQENPVKLAPVTPITSAPSYLSRQFGDKK